MTKKAIATALNAQLDDISLKRLAWAYGCAKKGSNEESALFARLLAKVEHMHGETDPR